MSESLTSSTAYSDYETRWHTRRVAVTATRYYADDRRARDFVHRYIVPAWRREIGATPHDDVLRRFRVTRTQIRMLHLFGRGVLGVGVKGSAAPRFNAWPPSRQKDHAGLPICFRVIPTNDICLLVNASRSAVDDALRRFKGRGEKGESLPERGLCNVISMETGVAIDGIFERQASLLFMYADIEYAHARAYAHECRVEQNRFIERQREWCDRALLTRRILKSPRLTPANQTTFADVG